MRNRPIKSKQIDKKRKAKGNIGISMTEVEQEGIARGMGSSSATQEVESSAGGDGKEEAMVEDEKVRFRVVFGKAASEVEAKADSTVGELKAEIEALHGVPPSMQKLMYKGMLKDNERTLREVNIKDGAKLMLVGSSPKDLLTVAPPTASNEDQNLKWDEHVKEEPISLQQKHRKVLDKGVPEGALPGIKGKQVNLEDNEQCIPGLLNALGNKVRLTFKPELQQLWIGSAQATQKVSYSMISKIESFCVEGCEEYSIVSLQIGPSSSTRYWLYYVPSQYVAAIKLRILGVMSLL